MFKFNPIKSILVVFAISFFVFNNAFGQSGDTPCDAKPFCSDSSYVFPNKYGQGSGSSAIVGPDYGCLYSSPNAIWYWMQIGTSGTIQLTMTQTSAGNSDIDFAMWGPYPDLVTGCAAVMNNGIPIQCSYSSSPTETIGLGLPGGNPGSGGSTPPAAIAGQVYIVVLTNYGDQQGTISFAQTGGTGSADCGIVCGLTATNSGNACLGENITLNAHTYDTVNVFNYYWSGPNGYTSTGKVTSVLPTAAGTYTYNVMGISSTDDTCNASTVVTIYPTPDVTITNPQDRVLCNQPFSNLVLNNPSDSTSYQWYRNGVALAGDTGTTYAASQNGNYRVSGTSNHGCTDTSVSVNVAFRFTESDFDFVITRGCTSDVVAFTNTGDQGKYVWNFGDGTPLDTTSNPVHVYAQQGIYTVRFKTTSSVGCVDSTIKIVNTNHPLEAKFSLSPDSVCQTAMTAVNFSDNSIGNIEEWRWNFGDGSFSTVQNPTHIYTKAGVHTIQLIITDDVPCSDTITHTIYVDSAYNFTVTADRTSICVGEEINFSIGNYVSNLKGTWSFGDGNSWSNNGQTTKHSYDKPGLYFPKLTVNFPICESVVYNSDSIFVHDFPKVDLGQDSTLCLNGNPIILQNLNTVNDPLATYKWSTGDTTKTLKVTHEGIYTLSVTAGTCTTKEQVSVLKDCYTEIPNAFTPNGDGENDYFYPRQLLSKGVVGFSMTIVNRWGQKVFETNTPNGRGWDGKFNGKDQPSGVYVYKIVAVLKNGRIENYDGNVTLLR